MDNARRRPVASRHPVRVAVLLPELPAEPLLPFRRRDLPGLCLSRHELDALLAARLVVEPVRGVYLDARVAGDPLHRAVGAGLALPPGAAVARRAAAWIHGIDARGPGELDVPLPMECVVRAGTTVPRRAGLVAWEAWLPDHDVTTVLGVPVTTPDRTACDLARYLRPFMGLGCLDAMARDGLVDPEVLAVRIEDWRGERNVALARRLIGWCDPGSESQGESWTRLRVLDAGFPRPTLQIWIRDADGTGLYRLDMGWEKVRKAIEYDGVEFHSRPEHVARDVARREDLARRFAWDAPGVVAAEVLGPSMALEWGVGEMLGLEPRIRRRLW